MNIAPEQIQTPVNGRALAGRYLTFLLGNERYGISVLRVRDIIRLAPATKVPGVPKCIKGVVNLRGKVVPLLDLRLKFGLEEAASNERTCIVVVQTGHGSRSTGPMGLIVDGVEAVDHIGESDIDSAPDFGVKEDNVGILGIAKLAKRVVFLLDAGVVTAANPTTRSTNAAC